MPPDLTFSPGAFYANRDELQALFLRHWRETGLDHDALPLDIDWERYAALETLGTIRTILARDALGKIRGYNIFVVAPHMHARASRTAFNDSFYIDPDYRSPWAYLRLMKESLTHLRAIGCEKVYISTRKHKDFSPVMRRLGFHHIEDNWALIL